MNTRSHRQNNLRAFMVISRLQADAKQPNLKSKSGFTLMESLMAIVVLTVLLAGIAPMLFLATATRVQARRVEQATQAARAYIDGVRNGTIDAPNTIVVLDELDTNNRFTPQRIQFADTSAPSATAWTGTCTSPATPSTTNSAYPYCLNTIPTTQQPQEASSNNFSLYCVDRDPIAGCSRDSHNDFVIQAYRSSTIAASSLNTDDKRRDELKRGYLLGLRVYRADAFNDNAPLLNLGESESAKQRTSGTSFNRKAPLIEITTEITKPWVSDTDAGTTTEGFRRRLGDLDSVQ